MTGNFLLASYPKSGNTWVRTFLSNLRKEAPDPADINELDGVGVAGLDLFGDAVGVEASCLSEDEMDRCRPMVFQYLARVATEPLFLKIHDAYTQLPGGESLVPPDTVRGVVYIVRNPLDVAVSYACHVGRSVDHVIEKMMSIRFSTRTNPDEGQVRQQLLSWSEHVLSWVEQRDIPVHVVRYEDMLQSPCLSLTAIARFCQLPYDERKIREAVRNSSFEELQAQEREKGFRERSHYSVSFFRSGKADVWKKVLTEPQIDRVIQDHGSVMRRFGYL